MEGQAKFNNPAVVVQSWYVAAHSSELRRSQVKSYNLLNRRIALYRDTTGVVHALDARCAHLGADLGQGQVVDNQLQCPFHHWCYRPDGTCGHAPGLDYIPKRRVRSYPTQERWGLIWIFNGPQPLFDLPELPASERYWYWRFPAQHLNCHPHLVLVNGLDITHFEALHDLVISTPPQVIASGPYQLTVKLRAKPRSRLLQYLTNSRQRDVMASFTTIASSLAWVTVCEPIHFHVLFSGRPSAQGGCQTQTIFFLQAKLGWHLFQAVALMYTLLHDDRRILNNLMFLPGFTENDVGLKSFAEIVNAMKTW